MDPFFWFVLFGLVKVARRTSSAEHVLAVRHDSRQLNLAMSNEF
jgi:hypothetical protein